MASTTLARTRLRAQRVLRITLVWVVLGFIAALFEHNALLRNGLPSALLDRMDERFLRSLLAGILGGGLYIFVLRDRWRSLPYTTAVSIMAGLMLGLLVILIGIVPAALDGTAAFGQGVTARLFTTAFLGTYLYWSLLMAGTMLMVRLNDQYGNGAADGGVPRRAGRSGRQDVRRPRRSAGCAGCCAPARSAADRPVSAP